MIYAQFYMRSTTGKLIEACGDRSVVILDGRCAELRLRAWADDDCRKRGYAAWQLKSGEAFTRSRDFSELVVIDLPTVDQTSV